MIINKNTDHVIKIIKAIEKLNGHCPCVLEQTDDTMCPCADFMNENICHCKLFVSE